MRCTSSLPKTSRDTLEASGYSLLGEEPLEPIGQETRLCPTGSLDVVVRDVFLIPAANWMLNSLVIQPCGLVTMPTQPPRSQNKSSVKINFQKDVWCSLSRTTLEG